MCQASHVYRGSLLPAPLSLFCYFTELSRFGFLSNLEFLLLFTPPILTICSQWHLPLAPPSFLSPIQIHDELIYEAPVGPAAKRVAQIVREEMESAVALAAPLRVKVKVGERWSQLREVARNAS